MYKVFIVDDEAVVRDGLKRTINWQEQGFDLVGDFANGREVLEAMENTVPDVIISDISMPFMDGLELAAAVVNKYPYVKIIILTGFDEFEYAQQAIRLKVSDFILKPITAYEMRELLHKVKREMDEVTRQHEDLSRLYSQLKQSLPLLKERFLERLVVNGLRAPEIAERFQYFGLTPLAPQQLVMVADIDDFGMQQIRSDNGNDTEILRYAAFNVLEEIAEREGLLPFRTREERMVLIFASDAEETILYEHAYRIAEEARFYIEKFLKFTVSIGVGQAVRSAEELPLSYKNALSALDYRFLLGKNRVLSILDIEGRPSYGNLSRSDWDRQLASAVKTGSFQEVRQLIQQFVADLKASMAPLAPCILHIQKVLISLVNTAQELGLEDCRQIRQIQLNDVCKFKTLDEIEVWLEETVSSVMAAIADNRNHYTLTQIRKAAEYIETHYAEEKMSLQDICRHVLMSTSYFSLVFKQHTGETFVEYLTRIRMEKAKEMLQHTTMKFYEIAGKVGYGDPNYFSILFKKHAGMTPREYRDRHAKERHA
ncbi:response regulator transcription factor [Paenibacillus sp.]|jgi:two-component system response regulator YesN|uniref:response regulator transcription factor n=1 Tax=Paenibacillus sp. TaxID=58172 RepID=UPI002829C3FD|nr:response regulator transcription factor [Paenibacillus sp.]MDR0270265.1 response regulator transcription factor [Paenibacillus sp.]